MRLDLSLSNAFFVSLICVITHSLSCFASLGDYCFQYWQLPHFNSIVFMTTHPENLTTSGGCVYHAVATMVENDETEQDDSDSSVQSDMDLLETQSDMDLLKTQSSKSLLKTPSSRSLVKTPSRVKLLKTRSSFCIGLKEANSPAWPQHRLQREKMAGMFQYEGMLEKQVVCRDCLLA